MPIFVPLDAPPEEPPTEPPVIHPEYHHGFTLVGGDNVSWDLVAGPVFILSGASGFGFPDPDHHWTESPVVDGAVHRGLRYPQREFAIPLEVDGRYLAPEDWRELETAIWRSLNPRRECRLVVTAPTGDVRQIPFRYSGGGDDSFEHDALLRGNNVYALEAVAGDPFWLGETIRRDYGVDEDSQTTFPGPPFGIGSSTAIQTTVVSNPGDEDAWPRWSITGPYETVTVGVAGAVVTLDVPTSAGESRVIDMDPRRRSIRDQDGNLAWSEASELAFAAVPAGTIVSITMSVAGALADETTISLEFDSRYLRAFS